MKQHSNRHALTADFAELKDHSNRSRHFREMISGGDDDPPLPTQPKPKPAGSKPFPGPPPAPESPAEEDIQPAGSNVYALLIGINHYEYFVEQEGDLNLHGCIRDSRLVEQYLKKKWISRNAGSFSAN